MLQEMEVLVKEWEGRGGEGDYERKALGEKRERMEEAYEKGESEEGVWGFLGMRAYGVVSGTN